jgi:predicted permease
VFRARIRALIRLLFFPAQADRDLDDELRFHLAEEARERAGRGLSEADALAAARRVLGNVARVKEETRAVWVSTRLEGCLQDLRFGLRILTKAPGISATAVVLIALVIGGNTTVFSIAHGILRKPAPGVRGHDLATVTWVTADGDIQTHNSYDAYRHFVAHSATVRPLAAIDFQRLTLTGDTGTFAVRATLTSPNYFEAMGARVVKGSPFNAADARLDNSGVVVVIAYHVWQNAFAGADDIVGRAVSLNGRPATVIGVAESNFRGAWLSELADVWVPLTANNRPWLQSTHSSDFVVMIGRRSSDTSLAAAQAELTTLWSQLQRADPGMNQTLRLRLVPYSATAGGDSVVSVYGNRMLAIFSVVTLLTIAIVCANVANLLIARAAVRQRELALRQSLGASRFRIVRGLLAEGLVLSAAAWCAASLLAWWVSKAVIRLIAPPSGEPLAMPDPTPDWTVIGYALALAMICTAAVTLGPALYTRRHQLLPFLRMGEQGIVQARSATTRVLVILQLAFSVLLLTSAGLAYRSASLQDGFDLGFDSSNVLLATVNTAGSAHEATSNERLLETLRARLQRVPGVEATSYARGVRLSRWLNFPVRAERSVEPVLASQNTVGVGYFDTVDVRFRAGHDFDTRNTTGRRTAIITGDLADALWPGEPAVGKLLVAGAPGRPLRAEVVGVVADAWFGGRGTATHPRYIFLSDHEQPRSPGETTFFIRHTATQERVERDVTKALRETDARVAVASLRSFDDQLAGEVAPLWVLTTLVMLFAAGSLLIAAIGQYALVTFEGRRRTREFGIRIALGASPQQLIRAVLADGFRWTAAGLALGFVLSVAAASLLTRVLFGVTPTDPLTYAGVFVLLSSASLAACYLPARRAAGTDPVIALRTE